MLPLKFSPARIEQGLNCSATQLACASSMLEQLLRDASGQVPLEQEAELMVDMAADKALRDTPASPNSRMREESILAGLGVIAPEEIGIRRIK